jgi:arabinose-5-phosphate isomerase
MRGGEDLPTVASGASLKEAVIEITRTGYGAVCVLDVERRLAGFLTDGDIRRSLLEIDDLSSVPVTAVMTASPLAVTPDVPLSEALLLLEQRRKPFLTAPVVDAADRCVGLLRLHDTVRAHLPA